MFLKTSALAVHGSALALVLLVLLASAQPLFTEDTWLHLALGEAYAAQGPWLDADPLLHTAEGPPAPAAWLSGVFFHGIERAFGFQGLRVAHVLLVAAILGLAWSALRRASGSTVFASLTAAVFVVLSSYRLFQLRPHLFTILATLLLLRLLFDGEDPPSWRRIAAATGLLALWANLHAGFVLGPALIGAGLAGGVAAWRLRPEDRPLLGPRAWRLAAALVLGLGATLLNPEGASPHLLYFAAGGETPALAVVADEWSRLDLFRLPVPRLPPSLLAWLAAWSLLLITPLAVLGQARRHRLAPEATRPVDLDLLALALVGAVGLLSATRFLWLGVVPLLCVGRAARDGAGPVASRHPKGLAVTAVAALLLVPGFLRFGDWPMISRGISRAGWTQPYATGKLDAQAVWFLRDAGIEGRLFNDYAEGNFLGYWLAPRLKTFVNGSLNLPIEAMEARYAVIRWDPPSEGRELVDLLDRYRIDVFFGTGLPVVPSSPRSRPSTTTHLESTPGWLPIFRSVRSGVYLRADERNRANLERVMRYYAAAGVPFDPVRGLDPEAVIRAAPDWARSHGLVPRGLVQLETAASGMNPGTREPAQQRLATLYAVLGMYERSAQLERRPSRSEPGAVRAARRGVWIRLHQGRLDEALAAAERLEAIAPEADALSQLLVSAAREYPTLREPERAARVARLPLLRSAEVPWLLAGFEPAEARPGKR